jgi:hypothetical protein
MPLQKTKLNTLRSIAAETHHNTTCNWPGVIAHLELLIIESKISFSFCLVGIAIPVLLFQQDKLTRAFLISQQAIPYRTRGGTCCPGVSTPKIRSLADSSMIIHITWQIPTISTIPTLFKSQYWSSPRSNHISTDGRPNTLANTQAKHSII